jgi:hypothetical protein
MLQFGEEGRWIFQCLISFLIKIPVPPTGRYFVSDLCKLQLGHLNLAEDLVWGPFNNVTGLELSST